MRVFAATGGRISAAQLAEADKIGAIVLFDANVSALTVLCAARLGAERTDLRAIPDPALRIEAPRC